MMKIMFLRSVRSAPVYPVTVMTCNQQKTIQWSQKYAVSLQDKVQTTCRGEDKLYQTYTVMYSTEMYILPVVHVAYIWTYQ